MRSFERLRILMVVMLGMIALGLLTWGIGKVYLELVGNSGGVNTQKVLNRNQQTDSPKETLFVLPKVTFWTCQIGVFKNEENALSCQKQLREFGLAAGVISTNPWVVGMGLGHSAEELSGLKQALAQKGVPAIVKQIELSERTFRIGGNGSSLTMELLSNVYTLLQEGVSAQILAQEKEVWDSQAGDHPPKELAQLHQLYSQLREQTNPEVQRALGLSLYFDAARIINVFSGK